MEVNYCFFADAASLDSGKKLNVLGIFDRIHSPIFPFNHPRMVFCCKITGRISEEGNHSLKICMVNEDGMPIGPTIDGNIVFNRSSPDTCIIFEMNGLEIPKVGVYVTDIVVDGQMIGTTKLTVMKSA